MRIVMNQYGDGDSFAVETSNDGSEVVQELQGKRKPGARISAYAEVVCDDTEQGRKRLKESLEFLLEEVQKRSSQPARV